MGAESLPIVCGYCRRPLRYIRGRGLIDVGGGRPHFYLGKTCLFVTPKMARHIDTLRGA